MVRVPGMLTVTAMAAPLVLASAAQQPETSPTAPGHAKVSLIGCLESSPAGAFRLTNARPAGSGQEESMTSAGAGASATGEGPSGSVSGDTPTGSTATETSAPTPAAGTPDARANPASGDYNRGERDLTAGTTGTVPRPEDPAETVPARRYRVAGGATLGLAGHDGHTVRIDGSLNSDANTAAADQPAGHAREPLVTATAIRRVADGCQR